MEVELGQSGEPRDLVGGDPAVLAERARTLRTFADHLGTAADGLEGIDLGRWEGAAGDAFRRHFGPTPRAWRDAATAFGRAADALAGFGTAVGTAQERAREAIDVHARAVAASEAARADHNRRVDAHNAVVAGGGAPPALAPFVDPATGELARAQQILAEARRGRDDAAVRAAGDVRAAAEMTAASPSTIAQIAGSVGDAADVLSTVRDDVRGGVMGGLEGIAQTARTINPVDPYNLTHPAAAAENLSGLGAGVARAVAHPTELVKGALGTGWGSHPGRNLGELLPNLALTAATGGGGAAARAGRLGRALERSENRPPGEAVTRGDPVDVVSGAQILAHTDVVIDAALPLVLSRVHVSSYELGERGDGDGASGGLFGPRWASTLDQRLEFAGEHVWFVREDAVVVVYPTPRAQEAVGPVAPAHAPPWSLARARDGWAITDPRDGLVRTFAASGALIDWSVPGGDHVTVDRDDAGHPVAVRHSGGHHVDVTTSGGRITGYSLRGGGEIVRFAHVEAGPSDVVNSSGRALRLTYDADGRLASWTDRNGVTFRSTYDARGRCVSGAADGGEMAWSFRYGPGVTEGTDALGNSERWEHDPRGRIVREVDALGAVTRSTWDAGDRLRSRTDPTGATTRWSYDEAGRLVAADHPDGAREVVERDAVGRPVAFVDATGARWERGYDSAGRLVSAVDPTGARTLIERDAAGHVVAVVDPLGRRTVQANDAAGRPVSVTDPAGAVTRLERDAFGRVVAHIDPLGTRTRYAWTVEGRLAAVTAPDGARRTWEYDGEGNEVLARDPLGRETRREYGAFDVLTAVVEPDGARTEVVHDPLGRLIGAHDARGRAWTHVLDAAGRTASETDPDGRTVRSERDATGRVVRRVNASGQEVRWFYDDAGRVATRWVDGVPEHLTHDAMGRLVRAVSVDADLELVRDLAGRVVAEVVDGRVLRIDRDEAGRVVGRRTPSGVESRWRFDDAGHLAGLDLDGRTMRFEVDAAGRETMRSWGAASLRQGWDGHDRLRAQRLDSHDSVVAGRDYTYRADDHLVRVSDLRSGVRDLGLDLAGRVTSVGHERYAYDAAGTLASSGGPEPHVLDGTRVRRAGSLVVRHDADGRVVLRQRRRLGGRPLTWHFAWDALDRLVGVTTPDGVRWRYRYDVFGRRIAKERLDADGAVAEQILVSWDGAVVAEQTVVGGETTVWEWEPGTFRAVAEVLSEPGNHAGRFRAVVADLVGTPTELVDADGRVTGSARASLWGRTTWSGESTLLRFPGQYHDAETGLAYNVHRYYDPETAQYASPDPLGLAASPHPRAYVPNPTAAIDPLGLQTCEPAASTTPGSHVGSSGIDAYQLTPTETVARHSDDVITRRHPRESGGPWGDVGAPSRPYNESRATMQLIMDSMIPRPDPGGVPGASRWDVEGTMNGRHGNWELVVDPKSMTIYHFLFRAPPR